MGSNSGDRAVSPVIGVILMVAITVVLAAVIGVMALSLGETPPDQQVETVVDLHGTNAGAELTPTAVGQTFQVRLNGETLTTLDQSSTGSTVFLPTAPDDEVLLVAEGDETSVLLREEFEAGEAGDFVGYYTFDGSGSTLEDGSRNGNHGDLEGDGGGPQWVEDGNGTALSFDGTVDGSNESDDYVQVDDLKTEGTGDVEAFTVATTFRLDENGRVQQLVEHSSGSEEWHIETTGDDELQFGVNYGDDHFITTANDALQTGETYVAVATYDGETYRLYLDGTKANESTYESPVDMGSMRIGQDDSGADQPLDGRLYEFRLYYTALDEDEVEMLTRAMERS
ncbi:type IV pilin [Natronomonas halophila]|uniref:LamG-like jellyroll fold domain-containing protein n=1 Tax=Natronomonas halophila TaxID=2747817 RepID=UPI0015B60BD6|nr:LamG-like jellyroll fold domain-containing protein [Natronomonas halophila]QLD84554.1 type IV pilin [Natronomonas halophila]